MQCRKSHKGFTLIELLMGLFILGCIFFLTAHSNKWLYSRNEVERMKHDLHTIIQFSKIQSKILGVNLTLSTLEPNQNNWAKGMVLFKDQGNHRYQSNQIIQQWEWRDSPLQLSWRGFQSQNYLMFTPNIRNSASNGYFQIQNGELETKLWVNRLGRIRDSKH